jgi:hypothetical protein
LLSCSVTVVPFKTHVPMFFSLFPEQRWYAVSDQR